MDLLILGASARSAAFSAIRLGLHPTCADLFADRDLAAACPVEPVDSSDYPDAFVAFADRLPPTSWLYTGALENRPDLVDRISERHPLLGNPGPILRAVRDPIALAAAVRDAGLVAPEVRRTPEGVPTDGSWLVKPRASAAGRGIRPWLGGAASYRRPAYFQERIEGRSLAAQFVGDRAGTRLLGITRQYVGRPGARFAYRGSLGPWPILDEVRGRVESLGRAIGRAFGLVGLFGVDLILREGRPCPIEVNPRYTASVEVLEWATGRSLLAPHLRAFGRQDDDRPARAEGFVGKALLHADRDVTWPDGLTVPGLSRLPEVADIPRPGSSFRAGEPVLTVFARGDTPAECRRALGVALREWRRRIRG